MRFFPVRLLIALSAAAALTTVLTWPLAADLGGAGRIDSGDGRHGVWNVAWVARALSTDPVNLYQANIFHPNPGALAFSEPNLLAGVIAIPVWLATGNALAAFNWVVLSAFVLAAVTAFALVHHLTGSVTASAVAGILFAFCAYMFAHLPHIQLLLTFGLPMSLLALHRFVDAPTPRRAAWLGAAMAVQGLACGYYGLFAALVVGWGLLWFGVATGSWRSWRYWAKAALAPLVVVLVVGPFLLPFADIQRAGFERTLDDARLFSADWRSYLASAKLADRWMLPLLGSWREVLFPGFLAAGLALGAAGGVFHPGPRRAGASPRRVVGFYLTLLALAMWASFGPDAGLYRILHETLPFFTLIRAPARFGIVVTLAVVILAGLTVADLQRRLNGRARVAVMAVVVILALAGSTVGPLRLYDSPPLLAAHASLARMPRGAVAEFPYFTAAADRHRHTEYMLASTNHWQPLINGSSDHTPPAAFADGLTLEHFPSDEAWLVLRRRGARYIVMHWRDYETGTSPRQTILRDFVGRSLRTVVDRPEASLFEIVGWPTDFP